MLTITEAFSCPGKICTLDYPSYNPYTGLHLYDVVQLAPEQLPLIHTTLCITQATLQALHLKLRGSSGGQGMCCVNGVRVIGCKHSVAWYSCQV